MLREEGTFKVAHWQFQVSLKGEESTNKMLITQLYLESQQFQCRYLFLIEVSGLKFNLTHVQQWGKGQC